MFFAGVVTGPNRNFASSGLRSKWQVSSNVNFLLLRDLAPWTDAEAY
jgi:hypothetical protein